MRRSERGANLVEMAIVLPLLVLLLTGVVDVGRAFYGYVTIANAAREGARAAAWLPCEPTDATQRAAYDARIKQITRNEVDGAIIRPASLSITITPVPATRCANGGERVEVTVSAPHQTILSRIVGVNTITLTAKSAMARAGKTP